MAEEVAVGSMQKPSLSLRLCNGVLRVGAMRVKNG
jgi:hypothetical protein